MGPNSSGADAAGNTRNLRASSGLMSDQGARIEPDRIDGVHPAWFMASVALSVGIAAGIAVQPVRAELTAEEKANIDVGAKEKMRKASEERDIAARDAVLKEKEAIKATVELKKKAEKEIE